MAVCMAIMSLAIIIDTMLEIRSCVHRWAVRIFERFFIWQVITDYFTSKDKRNQIRSPITGYKGDIVKYGRFDMESYVTN